MKKYNGRAKQFCCEDISLIENYEKMISDNTDTVWVCHHRLGIVLNKSGEELEAMGLYWNRPASELIFLTESEHISLHKKGKKLSPEMCAKMSASCDHKGEKNPMFNKKHRLDSRALMRKSAENKHCGEKHGMYGKHPSEETLLKLRKPKQKYFWIDNDDNIVIMSSSKALRWHPEYVCIGPAN